MTLLLVMAAALAAEPGQAFPETVVTDADGGAVRLDAPGQVTVVNLWATWCGPCLVELPLLDALHERLAGDGAAVVAVSLDDGKARPVALAKRLDLDLGVLHDEGGRLAASLAPEKLPTTYVVDADGTIRGVHAGALDAAAIAALEAEVRALLASQAADASMEAAAPAVAEQP